MKTIGLLFVIAFFFFFLGQVLWTLGIIMNVPFFGNQIIEDWIFNVIFTLCSIFGLIASIRLYNFQK